MVLAEDQRSSLLREVEELKTLAKEATDEATKQSNEIQGRLTEGIESGVQRVREDEQNKRSELEERLQVAEEAKLRLEEDILNKSTPRKRRMAGGEHLAITQGDESNSLMMLDDDSGPLSLTDMYTRLAETEDELRSEKISNQKLKILIDRIHRDVAAKTPIFHQTTGQHTSILASNFLISCQLSYSIQHHSGPRPPGNCASAKTT